MSSYLIGAGCSFPAGPTLALADIALRTGLALTRRRPLFVDRCGMLINASYFPCLPLEDDLNRWQVMCLRAMQDLLETLPPAAHRLSLRLWLVLPPLTRPGVPEALSKTIIHSLSILPLKYSQITVVHGGHAAGVGVINKVIHAQDDDTDGMLDIILAVDSWMSHDTLLWLDKQQLIHGSYFLFRGNNIVNPYGRVPGEGAAAIAICRHLFQFPAYQITGTGTGLEGHLPGDDLPCIGDGLSEAISQAWLMAGKPLVSTIFTDLNGEPYRADEYGFTLQRNCRLLIDDYARQTPALVSGDIGCATLITHAALAWWQQLRRPQINAQSTLLISSSDDETRGALFLKTVIGI